MPSDSEAEFRPGREGRPEGFMLEIPARARRESRLPTAPVIGRLTWTLGEESGLSWLLNSITDKYFFAYLSFLIRKEEVTEVSLLKDSSRLKDNSLNTSL